MGRENIWRNNRWKFAKFDENHEYKHPRSSMNYMMNSKRLTQRDIIIKRLKDKERLSKDAGEKQLLIYKGSSMRLSSESSSKTLEKRNVSKYF